MEPERIPDYSEKDMQRKHFDGQPLWVNLLAIALFLLLITAIIFPVFAQVKE